MAAETRHLISRRRGARLRFDRLQAEEHAENRRRLAWCPGGTHAHRGERAGGGADLRGHRRHRRPVPQGRALALHRAVSRRTDGAGAAAPVPLRAGERRARRTHRARAVVRRLGRDRGVRRHDLRRGAVSRAVRTGVRPPLGRPDRRDRDDPAHPGGPAPHHRQRPPLHHDLLLRAGAGGRLAAWRVRGEIDPAGDASPTIRCGIRPRSSA